MSEMSGPSTDSGSTDDQPSAIVGQTTGAPEPPLPEKASAPVGGGPLPVAGVLKLAEPGEASVPVGGGPLPVAGVLKLAEPGEASVPVGGGPLPVAGVLKLAEPGEASVPVGGGPLPVAGVLKLAEPGRASVPVGSREMRLVAPAPSATRTNLTPTAPGPPKPGGEKYPEERPGGEGLDQPDSAADDLHLRRLSTPSQQSKPALAYGLKTGNSPHFDVAAALRNAQKQASDAKHAGPPGMLHEATERWLRDAKPDALAADPIINRPEGAAARTTDIPKPAQPGKANVPVGPGPLPAASGQRVDIPKLALPGKANYEAAERMAPEAFDRLVFSVRRPRR